MKGIQSALFVEKDAKIGARLWGIAAGNAAGASCKLRAQMQCKAAAAPLAARFPGQTSIAVALQGGFMSERQSPRWSSEPSSPWAATSLRGRAYTSRPSSRGFRMGEMAGPSCRVRCGWQASASAAVSGTSYQRRPELLLSRTSRRPMTTCMRERKSED